MATPTYNKWKSTTVYGNLSVRDLTNSAGSSVVEVASVDLSGNFLSRGESTFSKTTNFNDNIYSMKSINQENQTLPSGVVNKFVYTSFLEAVQFGKGFNQNGTDANSLNNLSIKDIDSNGYAINTTSFTQTGSKTNTFASPITCNGTISNAKHLSTKEYVDSAISGISTVSLSGTNAWSGTNSFNTNLPTSTLTPSSATQLTTKTFVDNAISGLSSVYQTITGMSSYLTTSAATSTYQTISGMSSYLTTSSASSTYATIASLGSYLTTSSASSTYQTITGMSSYLTTSSASSTYSTLTNQVKTNAENTFTGQNQFNNVNYFNEAITQDNITLPSGKVNKLVYTSFKEAVQVGGYLTCLNRIKLPTSGASAFAEENELGYIKSGTFSTSAITSNTGTTLSTMSLPRGVWFVYTNVIFQSNATVGTYGKNLIAFNLSSSVALTLSPVGYGGNTTMAAPASTTILLANQTCGVYNITDATRQIRVNAIIVYTTTTISVNTGYCEFFAIRIA